jgi:CMP-N-acetylneuraminic acid synthetase
MKILGLIPARGGSKGVKRKNIRLVDGSPLIHYTIKAAQQSNCLTHILVDTDDAEIAETAMTTGVEVLKRPAELAQDSSSIVDVAKRIIEHFKKQNILFDILVLLQPTSPIRTGKNIDEAINLLLEEQNTEGVISVVPMEDTHPARMYTMQNHKLKALNPELESKRRQELEPVYYRNGCIYAIKVDALLTQNSFMPQHKKGYLMPSEWLANVDDERDLIITEALIKAWKNGAI